MINSIIKRRESEDFTKSFKQMFPHHQLHHSRFCKLQKTQQQLSGDLLSMMVAHPYYSMPLRSESLVEACGAVQVWLMLQLQIILFVILF